MIPRMDVRGILICKGGNGHRLHESKDSVHPKAMKKYSKEAKKKLLILAAYIVTTLAITALLWPWIRNLSTEDGRIIMKQQVESYGPFAPVIYILLHVFHVIVAFVPGEPIELLGGVLFGTIAGTLYSLLGIILGTAAVFLLVRKFGRPLVYYFVPEEKIRNHRLLQNESKLEWAVFLLFFIPGTPKDLLTYLVPLTTINPTRYLLIATLARIPSILSSAYVGSSFGQGKYLVSLIAFGVTGGIGLIGMLINKWIERRK